MHAGLMFISWIDEAREKEAPPYDRSLASNDRIGRPAAGGRY
jgi:hypothetical protein